MIKILWLGLAGLRGPEIKGPCCCGWVNYNKLIGNIKMMRILWLGFAGLRDPEIEGRSICGCIIVTNQLDIFI